METTLKRTAAPVQELLRVGVRQQQVVGIPISHEERDGERTGPSGSEVSDGISGTSANLVLIVN